MMPGLGCLVIGLASVAATQAHAIEGQVTWRLDNLESIDGHELVVAGDPRVIPTPGGRAIEFDGVDDGIFIDTHPLEGLSEFTVEVVFRPYRDGAVEQRYFHMQENDSESRVMFETRLVNNERWFLDTFIKSDEESVVLYASDHEHEIGPWYHAAIVVTDGRFSHFVNGRLELSEAMPFEAQGQGRTSLGVRINRVHWFKGAIRTIRFTPATLPPDAFLSAED